MFTILIFFSEMQADKENYFSLRGNSRYEISWTLDESISLKLSVLLTLWCIWK